MSLKWSRWLRGVVYDNFRYSEFLLDHLKIVRNEHLNQVCSFLFMTAIIFLVDPRKIHKKKKYSCSHFHGQKTIFISSVEKRTKKSYIPDTWFKEVRPSFRLLIERLFRSSVNDESYISLAWTKWHVFCWRYAEETWAIVRCPWRHTVVWI